MKTTLNRIVLTGVAAAACCVTPLPAQDIDSLLSSEAELGMQDMAEMLAEREVALAARDAAIHFNLGVIYDDNMHLPAKARRHYERFIELAPQDDDVPRVIEWLKGL